MLGDFSVFAEPNDEPSMTGGLACREKSSIYCKLLQNCVDTAFILPQYLVLRTLPVPQVGWLFAFGSPKLQGKIVHGGTMATKKKAKKKKH
jgi:hypothetical protein